MITLQNLTLQRGRKVLLDKANLTLFGQQKVGLIGANGTGKSSLFGVLLGSLIADIGEVSIPNGLRIAHMAQETPALDRTALDYVIDGDHKLREVESALRVAEQQNDGERIAHLHHQISNLDGYTAEARSAQLLYGLGFHSVDYSRAVSSFSGGWRMRLNLAQALMCPSDLLLLDEPTNHLDLDAVLWLEDWLVHYSGTLLLISHDRDFLDNVVTHIAHLEKRQLKLYTGNYSAFEEQRAASLALQQAAYEKQQQQRVHMMSFVNRFKAKASKAKQAQSRLKALERMELIEAAHIDSPFSFAFRQPEPCANPLLNLDKVTVGYDKKIILQNINFTIAPGMRLGLLGPNGAGKSTLIKLLATELQPLQGSIIANKGLKIGYFAQHQVDQLRLDESPLQHLQQLDAKATEQQLRTFLGGFDFCGDIVFANIKSFSGGEKSRLALAMLVWQKPNLLLLDEPTNHLDLDMRRALTSALQTYEGALIVVSHDRHLIRTTTDELLLVADSKVIPFTGDLDNYQQWLTEFRRSNKKTTEQKISGLNNSNHKERRALEQQLQKLEKSMAKLQQQQHALQIQLAEPNLYEVSDNPQLKKYLAEQAKITQQLKEAEYAWLELVEQLESLKE